jgi:hypothetical protein
MDIKAGVGQPSPRFHQVLEVHVTGRAADPAGLDLTSHPKGNNNDALSDVHYNDVSTQAAIALAVDMPDVSEYGSDASESDDAKSDSQEANSPPVKANAVIMNPPVESEEVDQEGKLNQLKLWREACWFTDFFRTVTFES